MTTGRINQVSTVTNGRIQGFASALMRTSLFHLKSPVRQTSWLRGLNPSRSDEREGSLHELVKIHFTTPFCALDSVCPKHILDSCASNDFARPRAHVDANLVRQIVAPSLPHLLIFPVQLAESTRRESFSPLSFKKPSQAC
jgi:hypothetical protein